MVETTHYIKFADLPALAGVVLKNVHETTNPAAAAVIALSGDLGAGKTTFVQVLAKELQISEVVTSPTFTVMKQYAVSSPNSYGIKRLVHMDAYRLESLAEAGPLRLAEILATPGTLVCIEWAEKIAELLPSSIIRMDFKSVSEDERLVTITSPDAGV